MKSEERRRVDGQNRGGAWWNGKVRSGAGWMNKVERGRENCIGKAGAKGKKERSRVDWENRVVGSGENDLYFTMSYEGKGSGENSTKRSSGDESVVAQSRCSMCDGCSSSPCASHYACTQTSFADSEFSDYHSLKWDDHNFQGDETVDSLLNDFIEISHERPGQKFLQEEAKEHKTIAKSQKKTIVCLVQSVLLLVKRNQDTENRLERLRRELTQMRFSSISGSKLEKHSVSTD
ncbi:hypothetical protein MAR_015092 [Mya arenaria]|uniref:Uncharacterized protein n=1 Tax=Mya arenaria TaxID=6604 RepID=A0ABY7FG16_MYAAR|nr:hypothetical protein MAR_015092 [Mya arenaria]